MNIISASRRTDIPAFFPEWFMNRLRAGSAQYMNPFSSRAVTVSLKSEDVHSIVFWTKDFRPMLRHLDELDARGYRFTVLYTITGMPKEIEPNVPVPEESIATVHFLAGRYSPRHVAWRFDPILFSDMTPPEEHEHRFHTLARKLSGATQRCIVSFVEFYGKVQRNLERVTKETGIGFRNPELVEKSALLARLAEIAAKNGMSIDSCCNEALVTDQVRRSHCIDGALLAELFPDMPHIAKSNPTRDGCGCTTSRDIGAYGTCRHNCIYCYANTSAQQVENNCARHDPCADALLPIPSTNASA